MDRVTQTTVTRTTTTTTTTVVNNNRATQTANGHVIPGADANRRGDFRGRPVQVVSVQQQPPMMPYVPTRGGGGVHLGHNVQVRNGGQVPLATQDAIRRAQNR